MMLTGENRRGVGKSRETSCPAAGGVPDALASYSHTSCWRVVVRTPLLLLFDVGRRRTNLLCCPFLFEEKEKYYYDLLGCMLQLLTCYCYSMIANGSSGRKQPTEKRTLQQQVLLLVLERSNHQECYPPRNSAAKAAWQLPNKATTTTVLLVIILGKAARTTTTTRPHAVTDTPHGWDPLFFCCLLRAASNHPTALRPADRSPRFPWVVVPLAVVRLVRVVIQRLPHWRPPLQWMDPCSGSRRRVVVATTSTTTTSTSIQIYRYCSGSPARWPCPSWNRATRRPLCSGRTRNRGTFC